MTHECQCRLTCEQQQRELHRLRASQRRLWAAVVLIPSLFLLVGAAQAREVADVVQAHSFMLLDKNGGMSATWLAGDPGEHRTGSASLIFNSDNGMAIGLSANDGNPTLIMNGGGNYVSEGRLGHVQLGTSSKQGPFLELWSQVGEPAASQGGKTVVQTPWGDNPKSIDVIKGESSVWSAPSP
jgi:hypothetical protein